jgi:hypothetical protein
MQIPTTVNSAMSACRGTVVLFPFDVLIQMV